MLKRGLRVAAVHCADDVVTTVDALPVAVSGLQLSVLAGQLVVVCGRVGSGKTALLRTLLGEMTPLRDDAGGTSLCTVANTALPHYLQLP